MNPKKMLFQHIVISVRCFSLQIFAWFNSVFLSSDRREVFVTLTTHIPEKLVEISSETRTVQATNSDRKLKIFLYFSSPVLNTSAEVLSVLRSSVGVLLPGNGRSLGNRRFDYTVSHYVCATELLP